MLLAIMPKFSDAPLEIRDVTLTFVKVLVKMLTNVSISRRWFFRGADGKNFFFPKMYF